MQEERIIHKLVWPEGKERALTLSYDDGVQQDRRLVALLRKYGVKATFNLNSGRLGRTERSRIFGPELDISTVLSVALVKLIAVLFAALMNDLASMPFARRSAHVVTFVRAPPSVT